MDKRPSRRRMNFRKSALPAQGGAGASRVAAWFYGIYAWIVFTTLVLAFTIAALLAGSAARARRLARLFAELICRLGGLSLSAEGLQRLPAGPHILLLNHSSFLDPILLIALLPAAPGYTFTTRREFALQVLLYPILRSVRTIVLKRHGDTERHTGNVETMRAALERGDHLLVFPEGEFGPEPGVRPFHSGAFIAAAQAGVPLVVAGLRGARAALPLGTWLPRRIPIKLRIGPTLAPGGSDPGAVSLLVAAARKAMVQLSGEQAVERQSNAGQVQ